MEEGVTDSADRLRLQLTELLLPFQQSVEIIVSCLAISIWTMCRALCSSDGRIRRHCFVSDLFRRSSPLLPLLYHLSVCLFGGLDGGLQASASRLLVPNERY